MTQPSIASAVAHRFAPGARVGAGTALAALVLAIVLGSISLDHDTRTGTVIFHALGIVTLTGGIGAHITASLRSSGSTTGHRSPYWPQRSVHYCAGS